MAIRKAKYNVINERKQPEIVHFETSAEQVKVLDTSSNTYSDFKELMLNGKVMSTLDVSTIKYSGTYVTSNLSNAPKAINSGEKVVVNASAVGSYGNPDLVILTLTYPNGEIYSNTIFKGKQSGWVSGGLNVKNQLTTTTKDIESIKNNLSSHNSRITDNTNTINSVKNDLKSFKTHNHDDRYVMKTSSTQKMEGNLQLASGKRYEFITGQGAVVNLATYNQDSGYTVGQSGIKMNFLSPVTINGKKVFTEDNDGKGSGLDADKFNGMSVNDFALLNRDNTFKKGVTIDNGYSFTLKGNNNAINFISTNGVTNRITNDADGLNIRYGAERTYKFRSNGVVESNGSFYFDASKDENDLIFKLNANDGGIGFYRNNRTKYLGIWNWQMNERIGFIGHEDSTLNLDKCIIIQGKRLWLSTPTTASRQNNVGDIWIG